MLGGMVMGKIVDQWNSKVGVCFNVVTILFAGTISLFQIERNDYSYMSFLFTFAWGFSDGCVNTHANQMMGFEFSNSTDPFSIFNALQAISVFVFMIA